MAINTSASLNSVIPGFSKNSASASNLIRELLSGKLTSGERNAIADYGAERATLGGMPGSTGQGGSLFANNDLRNIGLQSGQRQQQGVQDLLSMLGQYSGTVVPTAGQELQNQQFGQDLAFRTTQADRNLGLQQNEQDLNAAKFNELYGPKEYGTNYINTAGARTVGDRYYATPSGRTSTNASTLMFKYRR
jgi:hypothetical protein